SQRARSIGLGGYSLTYGANSPDSRTFCRSRLSFVRRRYVRWGYHPHPAPSVALLRVGLCPSFYRRTFTLYSRTTGGYPALSQSDYLRKNTITSKKWK